MSREIKFRAWDYDTNTMVYPDSELETTFCFDKVGLSVYHNNGQEMSSFELMQYTGLKDRNGKEIYEGDIIKFTDNYNTDIPEKIGVVKFNNASFYITDGAYSCYRWIDINVEVIGNIYENPDLLEDN